MDTETMMCKNSSENAILQTAMYKEWINSFKTETEIFRFMFVNNIVIASIKMNEEKLITLGFSVENLDSELKFKDLKTMMEQIREKTSNLADRILNRNFCQ
jgi:hypothetical protein